MRSRIADILAAHSLTWDTALFLSAVCAYFFALPLRSDTTVFIIIMAVAGTIVMKRESLFPLYLAKAIRWPLIAFLLFVLTALVASLVNPSTLHYFPRLFVWLCCVYAGVAFGLAFPRNGGRYLWAVFAAIVGSFAVAVIFQGYGAPSIWHDGRLKLFAMHPSRLALYAATAFLFSLYIAVSGCRRERLPAVLACLFLAFVQIKTNTRGNMFMLPFGVLFLGAALPRRYWKRFGIAVLLCAVLAGGAIWATKDTFTGKRLVSAVTNVTEDPNFKSRLPIWEAGWESFKKSPLIGHGYHSYLKLHTNYLKEHKKELDARYQYYEPQVKQAHNIVLGRLVETGVIGTAAFFAFYFGAVCMAWRGARENRWLVAPLMFYIAMSMLDDGLFRVNDSFVLFLAGNAIASGAFRTPKE